MNKNSLTSFLIDSAACRLIEILSVHLLDEIIAINISDYLRHSDM